MTVRLLRLTPHTFDRALQSALYLMIRIGRDPRLGFHPAVAEFFQAAYPRLFAFGALCRLDVRDPSWWSAALQSSLGPMRGGVGDGYYLLEGGVVIGHHSGIVHPNNVSYEGEHGIEAQRARIRALTSAQGPAREADVEAARPIIMYFDGIVARKQRSSGFEGSYVYEEREPVPEPEAQQGPRPPDPAASSAGRPDPFELLGVSPEATDAEIKTAFWEQMKMNHPDKVAHLSPALQQFAQAQVLAIKGAYEAIKAMRRR
ncbi:MAG TPA: hypothetical protein ENK18_25695 [Deltaproteobacteria bacterium]|nr:hypothetical protein [Deltaproteobacteria bacterium]